MLPSPLQADEASGIGWLTAQQQADGSYASATDIATSYQATSEVLRALATSPVAPSQIAEASNYLNADTLNNTEYLSRKIISQQAAGLEVSTGVFSN